MPINMYPQVKAKITVSYVLFRRVIAIGFIIKDKILRLATLPVC